MWKIALKKTHGPFVETAKMKSNLDYLKYLIKHKYNVYKAGIKLRVPLWQLIIHDWSKFLPSEWIPYRNHFYSHEKEKEGSFHRAWLYHQKRNPHHWQYWILIFDTQELPVKAVEMPERYTKEMVADWIGAGCAIQGHDDIRDWYAKNKGHMTLHPETRVLVDRLIESYYKGR